MAGKATVMVEESAMGFNEEVYAKSTVVDRMSQRSTYQPDHERHSTSAYVFEYYIISIRLRPFS